MSWKRVTWGPGVNLGVCRKKADQRDTSIQCEGEKEGGDVALPSATITIRGGRGGACHTRITAS